MKTTTNKHFMTSHPPVLTFWKGGEKEKQMNNETHKEKVLQELDRLRKKSARSWVLNATPEMVEEFRVRQGCGYSPDMREAIVLELERVSTDAA